MIVLNPRRSRDGISVARSRAEEVIPQQSADNSHAALLQAKAATSNWSLCSRTRSSEPTSNVPVVQNNRIHLAKIALGNDDGREVEIAGGLSAGELIAMNVGDGVEEGDPVQPVMQGPHGTSN